MAGTSAKAPAASGGSSTSTKPRKSIKSLMVSLKISPEQLRSCPFPAAASPKATEATVKDESTSSSSNTLAAATSASSPDANASESNSNTPGPTGTPSSTMPPPSTTEGARKRGTKRSSTAMEADGVPKVRGKPGPKKKPRLEDGTVDHSGAALKNSGTNAAGHKLGPKANQGAINAGLRALDRTGKPCRRWHKGGFTLKSFTGVTWGLSRWNAPTRASVNGDGEAVGVGSPASSGDSSKENKDSIGDGGGGGVGGKSSEKSENKSNIGGGVDGDAGPSSSAPASVDMSSPAPAIAASA